MGEYVYVLSTYGEYGAEDVCATMDREALHRMLDKHWGVIGDSQHEQDWLARAHAGLTAVLAHPDTELAMPSAHGEGSRNHGHDLHTGWGGMMLHVIRLDYAETPAHP